MKGNIIANRNELKNGQLIYVEFDYYDITFYTVEDYNRHIEYAEKTYVNGVFKVTVKDVCGVKSYSLERVDTTNKDWIDSLGVFHNFIDEIYEWVEE